MPIEGGEHTKRFIYTNHKVRGWQHGITCCDNRIIQ